MANNDKKRRAEKDLRELWQYIDAKYFLKLSKKEIIQKIESILSQISSHQSQDISDKKVKRGQKELKQDKGNSNNSTRNTNKSNRGAQQTQIKSANYFGLVSEDSNDQDDDSSDDNQCVVSRLNTQQFSTNPEDSLFNNANIQLKGSFKQLYYEILDKLEVESRWKKQIGINCLSLDKDGLHSTSKNILQNQIRNMFNLEFNKKYQASINLPIQSLKYQGTEGKSQNMSNSYMVFITDDLDSQLQSKQEVFDDNSQEQETSYQQQTQKQFVPNGFGFTDSSPISKMKPSFGFISQRQQRERSSSNDSESTSVMKSRKMIRNTNLVSDKEVTLDQELKDLEEIYRSTTSQLVQDINLLKKKVSNHKEPDSAGILNQKIYQEREYLQTEIISMENKQIAESIARVTHAKKIPGDSSQNKAFAQMVLDRFGPPVARTTRNMASGPKSDQKQSDDKSDSLYNIEKDNIGLQNRPFLLVKQLDINFAQTKADSKSIEHLFRLEFDQSSGIPATWVDTKTLNYFNKLRDNIFASSGLYDTITTDAPQQGGSQQVNKSGKTNPSQGTAKKFSTQPQGHPKDKNSVAFLRGKRSCTLADLNEKPGSIQSQLKAQQNPGKKSVQQLKGGRNGFGSLVEQGEQLLKNGGAVDSTQSEYGFCHHCKQLKNKNLLVNCNYTSKGSRGNTLLAAGASSQGGAGQGYTYAPYPYEPQNYTVNNVKIHNLDLQNKAQLRGLAEIIKKDLRLKNSALHLAQQSYNQFLEEGNGVSRSSCDPNTQVSFDQSAIQQNNQQLLHWLQELDVNPYTLDPNNQLALTTDVKTLFPNLFNELYPGSGNNQSNQKSIKCQASKNKNIDYECKRKFCTFCLRTNYEDNINDILKNKNWHCHHCTGYCICSRCIRQDITTQLKGYLMSLGGNLNTLRNRSASVFDHIVHRNFNNHLELTLSQNQRLYQQYPYYLKMLAEQDFKDPENQGSVTPHFKKPASNSKIDSLSSLENPEPLQDKFGFIQQQDSPSTNLSNGYSALQSVSRTAGNPRNTSLYLSTDKTSLALLFKFSLLNKKIDDISNTNAQASYFPDTNQPLSDKRFQEQITKSIKKHETDLVSKIQKRRGRKKFILSNDDTNSQHSSNISYLTKRDQKYLSKINAINDQNANPFNKKVPGSGPGSADLAEFEAAWPSSSRDSCSQLQKLLSQFNLNRRTGGCDDGDSDNSGILRETKDSTQKKKEKGWRSNGNKTKKQTKLNNYFGKQ